MQENDGLVECPICHIKRKNLGWHIRRIHKLSKAEFKKAYPNSPIASQSISDRFSKSTKNRWNKNYLEMKAYINLASSKKKGINKVLKSATTMEERFQKGRTQY